MEPVHLYGSVEKMQAYTEAALFVYGMSTHERLTPRRIVRGLSHDSVRWAGQLSHGHDETFRDTFMDMLIRDEVLDYDHSSSRYGLGNRGDQLVANFLDQMVGDKPG
jgi:hypothetical protein